MLKGKTTGKEKTQGCKVKEEGLRYSLVREITREAIEKRLKNLLTDKCIQVTKIMTASEWRRSERDYAFTYEDTAKQDFHAFEYNYFVVVKHIKA